MTYRAILTAADGTTETRIVTQDEWDDLIDTYEVSDSAYPTAVREREMRDGTWKADGGWDIHPAPVAQEVTDNDARRRETLSRSRVEMMATAAANTATDRREARRSYYLRTGR